MGPRESTVGGGPATGLANDFIGFLQSAMNTGTFGGGSAAGQAGAANPMASTQGIAGVLNDILSGGAGQIGGNMQQMIARDTDRQALALRERFTNGGGVGYGSPAAGAEALLRSESGAKNIQAIGGMQMQALMPILQMIMQLSGKGISQRETVMSPSPWLQGISAAAGGLQALAPFLSQGPGGRGGNTGGGTLPTGTNIGNTNIYG